MADDPVVAAWSDFWQLQPRPDGRRRPTGADVASEGGVAGGPVRGLAISTTALSGPVAIAWLRHQPNPLVAHFVDRVREPRTACYRREPHVTASRRYSGRTRGYSPSR